MTLSVDLSKLLNGVRPVGLEKIMLNRRLIYECCINKIKTQCFIPLYFQQQCSWRIHLHNFHIRVEKRLHVFLCNDIADIAEKISLSGQQ